MVRGRRGIFLISVLFLVVMLIMFVGASFELGAWGLKRTTNQASLSAARRAARSGVEYALARLRVNPNWKAAGARQIVVNQPNLVVVEEQGNVVGLLREQGQTAQFRIRFNFHDGAGGADGLPDVTGDMNLNSLGQVSFNNVVPNVDGNVPSVDASGSADPGQVYTVIPGHSVQIYAEGRCGDGLRDATSASPNPPQGGLAVTTAFVETVYKVNNPLAGGTPSAAASASSFSARLADWDKKNALKLDSADNNVVGRIRSRSDMTISGGKSGEKNLTSSGDGEYRSLGTFSGNPASSVVSAPEGASDNLLPITWAQVDKAAANPLPAGTYVFWDNGTLHYYDMTPDEYRTFMANPANHSNPGTALTQADLPPSVTLTISGSGSSLKAEFKITDDTLIEPSATGKTDFGLLPKKAAAAGPGAPGGALAPGDAGALWSAISAAPPALLTNGGSNWVLHGDLAGLLNAAAVMAGYPGPSYNMPGGSVINNLGQPNVNFDNIQPSDVAIISAGLWAYVSANPSAAPVTNALSSLGGPGMADEIPGMSDALKPQNITMLFEPSNSSAVLSGPGSVTIGAKLEGVGGSITSEGDLNLVGLGVNFSAASNPNEGVSLYSKQDILLSTYDKTGNKYRDAAFKGVVYCWGDFLALLGSSAVTDTKEWGKLKMTGSLVAYGKDPSDTLSPATKGKVDIIAEEATLKYDPAYIANLTGTLPTNISLGRVRWKQD